MKKGLVLGKFMPIHNGHIQLIEFAANHCDELLVWICVSNKEKMPAELRHHWVSEIFKHQKNIKPILFEYDENIFPNSSESSMEISQIWAKVITKYLPKIDIVFTCEKYGDYIAEYLNIDHIKYPENRIISATIIRNNPYKNWNEIPEVVKPYFFKKIAILGTESTGKTVLTEKLAQYFSGDMVSEIGRDIVENSNQCTLENLSLIAEKHAEKILAKQQFLKGLLFIDTDIHITKSYSKFLFQKELNVASWITHANVCNLNLFLENDANYIQDGTRLSKEKRDALNVFHKAELKAAGIEYKIILGNWDERFKKSIQIIESHFNISK